MRTADCCGACGTQLQPIVPTSEYAQLAVQLCLDNGITQPGPLLLAHVAHVAVVHSELTEMPPLVPFDPKRKG